MCLESCLLSKLCQLRAVMAHTGLRLGERSIQLPCSNHPFFCSGSSMKNDIASVEIPTMVKMKIATRRYLPQSDASMSVGRQTAALKHIGTSILPENTPQGRWVPGREVATARSL
mmetsp:Transcript_19127/g.41585  ORF Transcript_19127/g.41585 Transcript_19127/m.41585 type:complete len:115 (-) Transcript_19127:598-942(-)